MVEHCFPGLGRRLKDQQAQTLQGASQRAAIACSCCSKAAAVPLEATAKPLRSPVKMWISAAVDDSEVTGRACFANFSTWHSLSTYYM